MLKRKVISIIALVCFSVHYTIIDTLYIIVLHLAGFDWDTSIREGAREALMSSDGGKVSCYSEDKLSCDTGNTATVTTVYLLCHLTCCSQAGHQHFHSVIFINQQHTCHHIM